MRNYTLLSCLISVASIMSSDSVYSQIPARIDAKWLAKTSAEAPAIVAKYEALLPFLDETSEAHYEGEETRPIRSLTSRTVRLGDNALLERGRFFSDASKQPSISLACDNADYYFNLHKTKKEAPFALTDYALGARKLPVSEQTGGLYGECFRLLKSAVEALDPANRAKLRSVGYDAGNGLLTIEYAGSSGNVPFSERVAIDPAQGWIIKGRRLDNSSKIATTEYTYGKIVDNLTFPTGSVSSIVSRKQAEKAQSVSRLVVRVLDIKRTTMTAADFRLSAFGLPEPFGVAVPPRPTRWYIWILVAAGACAVLAFALSYLHRRLQARRASTAILRSAP